MDRTKEMLEDFEVQSVMRGIEEETQALTEAEQSYRGSISEYHFVNVFLPFFSGSGTNHYGVDLRNWITVAGDVFSPVDVYDAQGVVQYTIPPLLRNDAVSPKEHDPMEAISEIMQTGGQILMLSPRQGKGFIRDQLQKRINQIDNQIETTEYLRVWNTIFTRYNLEPIVVSGMEKELGVKIDTVTKSSSDYEEDFTYEPL